MTIVWSVNAESDYLENIEYLLKEWTEESASNFIEEVEAVLELLKVNPKLFPTSNYKSIRRAVIRKQITLFYKESKDTIYLVRFWNTFKNPESLNL